MGNFSKKIIGLVILSLTMAMTTGNAHAQEPVNTLPNPEFIKISDPSSPFVKYFSDDYLQFAIARPSGNWWAWIIQKADEHWLDVDIAFVEEPIDLEYWHLNMEEFPQRKLEINPKGSKDGLWEKSEPKVSVMIDGREALKREFTGEDGRTIVQYRITENYPETWNENNLIRLKGNEKEMKILNKMLATFQFYEK